jgi:peroxiredoxin
MDTLIANGQTVPDFNLPDLEGRRHALQDDRGRIAIVNFWSAECPWVERTDRELTGYLREWGEQVALLPVAANANETPALLAQVAAERGLPFVLHDAKGQVADLFGAQTTPHLFVIDARGVLRYQGAFDDVTFRQRTATQLFLRQALTAVLAGRRPDPAQTPPYGCAITRYAA